MLLSALGCRTFPALEPDQCGNHLVDVGEDCDDVDAPDCSGPAAAAPCRFICDPAHQLSCRLPDSVCGDDLVCSKPRGSYTLGPALTEAGMVQSGDFNGDGAPDLGERAGAQRKLWQNDGRGHF